MALPYENMTVDTRAQQRQDRLRRREVWPKDGQENRHHYEIGSHVIGLGTVRGCSRGIKQAPSRWKRASASAAAERSRGM